MRKKLSISIYARYGLDHNTRNTNDMGFLWNSSILLYKQKDKSSWHEGNSTF